MRESEVVSYIKHINDCLKKRANNSLRKEGLTLMQSHVLLKLQDAPDQRMTFKETAGLLGRLQEKNLIHCCDDSKDKRIKVACLTQKGESHCAQAKKNMAESNRLMMKGLTQEEMDTLAELLKKVYSNLENEGKGK